MEAARAILDKYYVLRSTSFDITLLHPFVTVGKTYCSTLQGLMYSRSAGTLLLLCKFICASGSLKLETL